MSTCPHIPADDPRFPGDATAQPPFGLRDSVVSAALWGVGIPHLAGWAAATWVMARLGLIEAMDPAIKTMCRMVTRLAGISVRVRGTEHIDPAATYVYVANHVNLFDMFVLYQAIPHFARALELAEHFSWPVIGPFLRAAGQIPVDPKDPKRTAAGLKRAAALLESGRSVVVLPEGSRTLDGSVGPFYPGAFRLAVRAEVPIIPMAIHGGRAVNRRGDWRIRPGRILVRVGVPIDTKDATLSDVAALSDAARDAIVAMLQEENARVTGRGERR